MHGVSGAFGDDVAEDVMSGKGEIADEVEDLMADELIIETQRAVEDALTVEDDGAGFGDAADEAHVAQHLLVFLKAESARRGDLRGVVSCSEVDGETLAANRRGEIDLVGNAVAPARIDADELIAFADFDSLADAEVFAAAALCLEADVTEGFDIGERTAVEDGELEVVNFDDDVVDAASDEGRKQVLGGGDEHTLAHQAGGVADLGDVAAGGRDFEVVEVGAAEEDSTAAWGGE